VPSDVCIWHPTQEVFDETASDPSPRFSPGGVRALALCGQDGDCIVEQPWMLNIPQFVEVNLKDKLLSTTKASGENRSTPLRMIQREDGLMILQGAERGRTFGRSRTREPILSP
jgi:hypothetical protein